MSRADLPVKPNGTLACPQCGCDLSTHATAQESQLRIQDLEAQVRLLNEKATAAVDKLADYEDEVRYLRSQRQQQQQQQQQQQPPPATTGGYIANGGPPNHHHPTGSDPIATAPPAPSTTATRLANLTSFIPGRRPSPLPNTSTSHPPGSPSFLPAGRLPAPLTPQSPPATLAADLARERALRQKLESQLDAQSSEVEELTAQLFSQANEMVATERRAKAKLEERIRLLEEEWKGRTERLKKLEERVGRSERIRSMLSSASAGGSVTSASEDGGGEGVSGGGGKVNGT